MIDRHIKRRTDISLSPIDLAGSYVDSTFNEGSINLRDLIAGTELGGTTSAIDIPIFHPGSVGGRTTPGDGGFAYADSPQATVFIEKKQWAEQEFTYLTSSRFERLGKQDEIRMRLALGRLISRKLDLLNSHELMTKLHEIGSGLKGGSGKADKTALNNIFSSSFSGTPVTQYYVEDVKLETPDEDAPKPKPIVNKREVTVEVATQLVIKTKTKAAPGNRLRIRLGPGVSYGVIGGLAQDAVVTTVEDLKLRELGGEAFSNVVKAPEDVSEVTYPMVDPQNPNNPKTGWFAIDLASLKESDVVMFGATQPSYIDSRRVGGAAKALTLMKDKYALEHEGVKYGYVAAKFAKIVDVADNKKVKITLEDEVDEDAPKPVEAKPNEEPIHRNQFNGVIELANVTSIQTQNSLTPSPDKATIELENPNNILYISADDIEIALEQRTVSDELITSDLDNGADIETRDPETGKNTTLKFHEGRFYTQRGFDLVTNALLDGQANFKEVKIVGQESPTKAISKHIDEIETHIKNLQDYKNTGTVNAEITKSLRVVYPGGSSIPLPTGNTKLTEADKSEVASGGITITSFPVFPSIGSKAVDEVTSQVNEGSDKIDPYFINNRRAVGKKIQKLSERRNKIRSALVHIKKNGFEEKPDPASGGDPEMNYRRAQLRKYYQNRTIFEVYDRIYIWMTSPSRTNFRLEDGTIVGEAPSLDAQQQIVLQRIREIISLLRQLDNTIQDLGAQLGASIPQQFSEGTLQRVNEELFQTYASATLEGALGLEGAFKGDPTIQSLAATIEIKLKSFEQLDPKNIKPKATEKSSVSTLAGATSSSLQSLDPGQIGRGGDLAGLAEEQFQVFQGVVVGIDRTQSDGKFKLKLTCEDNLNFLSRSRYIEKPALGLPVVQTRRFLDDPIWRKVSESEGRDHEMTKKPEEEMGVELAGRWKTGILTISAGILQKRDEEAEDVAASKDAEQTPNFITELQRRILTRTTDQVFNEPFRGADPASIVSLLVTGQPFDVTKFIDNLKTGTALQASLKDDKGQIKQDEKTKVGNVFEQTQAILETQLTKYGDFDPIVDLAGLNISDADRDKISIASIINITIAVTNFIKDYVVERDTQFSSTITKIQDNSANNVYKKVVYEVEQKNGTESVPSKKNNIDKIFPNFKPEVLETEPSQLVVADLGDDRLTYLIRAAVLGSPPDKLNDIFKFPLTAIADKERLKPLVLDYPSKTATEFHKGNEGGFYALSSSERSAYDQIFQLVRARFTRGGVINVVKGTEDNPKKAPKVPTVPTEKTAADLKEKKRVARLRGVELNEDGTEIVSGSVLQSARAAIAEHQKANYLVVSGEYFRSPNLIDYIEQIAPTDNESQQDVWRTVLERCKKSADMMDWEFYADSQGHIRYKEPTYNRTLLRHILDVDKLDSHTRSTVIQLLIAGKAMDPAKLITFRRYQNLVLQLKKDVFDRIEFFINEALGFPVSEESSFSSFFGKPQAVNILGYILQEKTGGFTKERMKNILAMVKLPVTSEIKEIDDKKKPPASALPATPAALTSIEDEATFVFKQSPEKESGGQADPKKIIISEELASLLNAAVFTAQSEAAIAYRGVLADREFDLIGSIQELIVGVSDTSEALARDELAKTTVESIEACVSIALYCTKLFAGLEERISGLEGQLTNSLQDLTDEKHIHIVPSAIILNESYSEEFPAFTRLDVLSTIPQLPGGSFSGQVEKDTQQWAGSVDYDLWRIYGHKQDGPRQVSFLRTVPQAVLYAHMLMARQYGQILKGSITVRGDSKYQVGDTVYIEDENIYYYIQSVSHSFSFGTSYKTTLSLTYGRRPGSYIPYPFDVLGSAMIDATTGVVYQTNGDPRKLIENTEKADAAIKKETT